MIGLRGTGFRWKSLTGFPGLIFSFIALVGGAVSQQARIAAVDQVNEMIGTAGDGQTFPATGMPYAMTQWTPQTRSGEAKCVAPFYAADRRIQGFRGSHFLSGSCTQDYGSFTLMPLPDALRLDPDKRSSRYAMQSAKPYLYSVDLLDSGIHAEMTGTERSGMMRFRFRHGAKAGWVALENNLRLGQGELQIDERRQELTGVNPVYRIYAGGGKPAGFSGYVVVRFDRPFRVGGTWSGTERSPGAVKQPSSPVAAGSSSGAYVSFKLGTDETVMVKIGTSFTSLDEARKNLEAEIPDWDFAGTVARVRGSWDRSLATIQVAGDSAQKRIFYTAMYHTMLSPRIESDVDGTYPKFGDARESEHATGFTYYDDFSVWDTFRALHPLMTLLDPTRDLDMVKSLIAKGEQGGFLPIFPAWNSYTTEMAGDHATAIITDAYVKGIRGFDAEVAYRVMKKNAMEVPADLAEYKDGRGRRALDSYMKYGYIPLEDHVLYAFHKDEQVSRTLDYAYDDSQLATMARALGHTPDARMFEQRAGNWRNVIDPETGFARGRFADGRWVTPFEPSKRASYITESSPWVNTFFVVQDIPGLIAALGGKEKFIAKLDGVFSSGAYDHGNEPSHHIAYLYDDAGAPEKTQAHVREIMAKLYRDSDDGLIGNDDAGQMSAWYVFSAMGFYPVTPGTDRYSLGSPIFDEVTLRANSDHPMRLVARGAEAGKVYVREVRLNGVKLDRTYVTHSELLAGGELDFVMTATPTVQ